ncbi:hypothetical protein CH64_585 [Yersinia rohdei]|uniref:Uncharacterized protein n=1 Tax=Yersinia rohdei TaxID=29485 RepID=A0ABM5S7H1_YERRO|nr:hypothetical protein CH64_585 [Yersinia rohdei]
MSHRVTVKFIRPVSSQTFCHILAGAAVTWPSAQHNRLQAASVMIEQSTGVVASVQVMATEPLNSAYLYIGAYNVYYVKLNL